jgi:putative N-acetyltransferase (TIGR04045 family)
MILEPVSPFRSRHVTFKPATEAWELQAYFRLRKRIFCDEQGLFEGDDGDSLDERAGALVALANVSGMPDEVVGVVRIWERDPAHWWGGRLGTHPVHRGDRTIAPGLIRLAVGTACRRGARSFHATVQLQNVGLFERLHWRALSEVEVCGRPHALMEADLLHYGGGPA